MVTECMLLTDSPWEHEEVTRIGEFRITVANPREDGFDGIRTVARRMSADQVVVVPIGILWGMEKVAAERLGAFLRWLAEAPLLWIVFYANHPERREMFEAWRIVEEVRARMGRERAEYGDGKNEDMPYGEVRVVEGIESDFLRLSEDEIRRLLGWEVD